jgi:hypothetical protein
LRNGTGTATSNAVPATLVVCGTSEQHPVGRAGADAQHQARPDFGR